MIDFHTHGKLAKYLPFSAEYTHWLFAEASLAGLDAICLTEHFNTQGFTQLYRYIADTFPRKGDAFCCGALKIFSGMEVDIAEGGHTLVIGAMEHILSLYERLMPYREKGDFLLMKELAELVREYPLMFGAAHPYRPGSSIPFLPEELLVQFDFIDLNGKDVAENGEAAQKQVFALADKLGLPVVAGSDTHQSFQYGSICNEFKEDCLTVGSLRDHIKQGDYKICISPKAEFQVRAAGILKRALKEIHALNGDYVSVLVKEVKNEPLGV